MPISQTAGIITAYINNLRINILKISLELTITNLLKTNHITSLEITNLKRQRSALFATKKAVSQTNILKRNAISQRNDFKKAVLINILQTIREKKIKTRIH